MSLILFCLLLLMFPQDPRLRKAWAAERFAENSDRLLGNQEAERGDIDALFAELVGLRGCMLEQVCNNTAYSTTLCLANPSSHSTLFG